MEAMLEDDTEFHEQYLDDNLSEDFKNGKTKELTNSSFEKYSQENPLFVAKENRKQIAKRCKWNCVNRAYEKDGVRAWVVCTAVIVNNILIFGCSQTYGVMFPVLLDEFGESKGKTAWVGSLAIALTMAFSPLAAILIDRFGVRKVAISGGFTAALGLFITSQVNSIDIMYLTYSLIFGIGSCMAYNPGFTIIPQYFDKHLALANGLMQAGSGAAIFTLSPINHALLSTIGWRYTFVILGGFLCLVAMTSAILYIPNDGRNTEVSVTGECSGQTEILDSGPNEEVSGYEESRGGNKALLDDQNKESSNEVPLKKNIHLIIYSVGAFLFQFGNTIPLVHLGRHGQELGLTSDQTTRLYIGFGVSSSIGRVMAGRISASKRLDQIHVLSISVFVVGFSTTLVVLATGFPSLLAYFCINGLAEGVAVVVITYRLLLCASERQRPRAIGFCFFWAAMGYAFGSPFGGFLADQVGSYVPVFCMAGGVTLASCAVFYLVKCQRQPEQPSPRKEAALKSALIVTEKLTSL